MSHLPLDARAILEYLNELGYRNISAEQLKEFLKDLRKLIKYEENICVNTLHDDYFENLYKRTTASYRAKVDNNKKVKGNASQNHPNSESEHVREKGESDSEMVAKRPKKIHKTKKSKKSKNKAKKENVPCSSLSSSAQTDSQLKCDTSPNVKMEDLVQSLANSINANFAELKLMIDQFNVKPSEAAQRSHRNNVLTDVNPKVPRLGPIEDKHSRKAPETGLLNLNGRVAAHAQRQLFFDDIHKSVHRPLTDRTQQRRDMPDTKSASTDRELKSRIFTANEATKFSNANTERRGRTMQRNRIGDGSERCRSESPKSKTSTNTLISRNYSKSRTRKPFGADPVALYQYYRQEWQHFRKQIPGENSHSELRWKIRHKLLDPA